MNIFVGPHRVASALAVCGLLLVGGCSQKKPAANQGDPTFPMGSQVAVGSLIYTVIDSEWRDHLQAESERVPKHRFLLLTVSVTNSGGADAGVPLLTLEDEKGNTYMEEEKGDGVDQWLGYFRLVKPGSTEQGKILFDVAPAAYKLRVTSGGDPEQERTSLVEIPLKVDAAPSPTSGAPAEPVPQVPAPLVK